MTTAVLHYGKGIAHSVLGNVEEASKERQLLHAATLRVPPTRIAHDFPNKCTVVLEVAKAMLDGELEYSKVRSHPRICSIPYKRSLVTGH